MIECATKWLKLCTVFEVCFKGQFFVESTAAVRCFGSFDFYYQGRCLLWKMIEGRVQHSFGYELRFEHVQQQFKTAEFEDQPCRRLRHRFHLLLYSWHWSSLIFYDAYAAQNLGNLYEFQVSVMSRWLEYA